MRRIVLLFVCAGLAAGPAAVVQAQVKNDDALAAEKSGAVEPHGEQQAEAEFRPDAVSPEIVVTGERLPDKAVNRYIYDMLRPEAVGQERQYPRLVGGLCPSVIGFSAEVEGIVEARLRLVAEAAGIEVADAETCSPNLHLMRVEDGRTTIRYLRQTQPRAAFGFIPLWRRDQLERSGGPVFAWHQVAASGIASGLAVNNNVISGSAFAAGDLAANYIPNASRSSMPVTLAFSHSVVLVEDKALSDVTAIQLADFALMRGLMTAREDEHRDGARTADSILNLFDEAVEPQDRMPSLGRMDLALLTSLYAVAGDVRVNQQRGRMVATFRKVLEELE